jgi:hypothetical protein
MIPRAFGPVITKIPPMDEVLRRHSDQAGAIAAVENVLARLKG